MPCPGSQGWCTAELGSARGSGCTPLSPSAFSFSLWLARLSEQAMAESPGDVLGGAGWSEHPPLQCEVLLPAAGKHTGVPSPLLGAVGDPITCVPPRAVPGRTGLALPLKAG